jgi:hypothetical protein
MNVEVNILELASELAHNRLVRESDDVNKIYKTDEMGTLTYTEDAQDVFNRYYDHYYDVIWECKADDILT